MRDCRNPEYPPARTAETDKPSMITKWLQSAEKFRPNEGNYIDWSFNKPQKKKQQPKVETDSVFLVHGKEELDAAEALTSLANSSRQQTQNLKVYFNSLNLIQFFHRSMQSVYIILVLKLFAQIQLKRTTLSALHLKIKNVKLIIIIIELLGFFTEPF